METNEQLVITLPELSHFTRKQSLSLMAAALSVGKLFSFTDPFINKEYLTEEVKAELAKDDADIDPIVKMENTQYLFSSPVGMISLRASSILNLRVLKNNLTEAKRKTFQADIDKDTVKYTTVGQDLFALKEEDDKAVLAFPAKFTVQFVAPVHFKDIDQQTGKTGKGTVKAADKGKGSYAYPPSAYVKFDEEIAIRKAALEAKPADANGKKAEFNINDIYTDAAFKFSLRGTPLKNEDAQPYKMIYVTVK